MQILVSIGKGILIGAGAILPGISSGVLCVVFGIYEKLVDSVLGIFKDFKKLHLFISNCTWSKYWFSLIWKFIKLLF